MFTEVKRDIKFEDDEKDNIAIIDFSKNSTGLPRKLTFREMSYYISSVARTLLSKGYKSGDRIAIVGLNSFKFASVYLGARLAGITPVVINHKLSKDQMLYVLAHSESKLVFHDDQFLELLPAMIPKVRFSLFGEWINYKKEVMDYEYNGDQIAVMLYTSGSTGKPKCVSITVEQRQWAMASMAVFPSRVNTIVAQPLSHINALNVLESCVICKAKLFLLPKFTVEKYKSVLLKSKISRIAAIPSMLAMLLADDNNVELMKTTNVKTITLSGAPTSEGLYERITTAFPNARLQLTYGMSETGPGVFDVDKKLNIPKMSVGKEFSHIQYKLVDDVLFLKSPGLFNGYHLDEAKTNSSYDSEGYFNTRDKFRVDENGFYYFTGRADDMFVSGGENIFPAEVEEILNSHPSIMESFVISLDDEIKGTKAYAFVIVSGEFDEQAVKDYYATKGPAYQIPRRIWPIESFPVNYINKVDKLALKELAQKLLGDSEPE